jgi:hypothetical protein
LREPLTGLPNGLFRQIGAFQFEDVSSLSRLEESSHYSHGCAVGDFDNDGFQEIVVTGYGGLQFFQNRGDGTFDEAHQIARLDDTAWSSSAGWGDFNSDGNLDLYIAHYVDWSWENHPRCLAGDGRVDICPPRNFRGLGDTLYLSTGDGTFFDSTPESGLVPEGKGLGVVLADADCDGDLDAYVANDTVDNFFYVNDGSAHFRETGTLSGLATDDRGAPNGSMGIAVLDYDGNQLPDLWVANYENESFALYRNEGNASFSHVSQSTGIHALGGKYVGFGTAACDLDRDADEDLVVSNGHVVRYPNSGAVQQEPLLMLNDRGSFHRMQFPADVYFGQKHHGRGLAIADLDDDGDHDFVVSHNNDPVSVVKNETELSGSWLGMCLVGRRGNRDAVGARLQLDTSDGRSQFRTVIGGGSYLSHSDLRPLWCIPIGTTAIRVRIAWPSGMEQVVPLNEGDRYLQVLEP